MDLTLIDLYSPYWIASGLAGFALLLGVVFFLRAGRRRKSRATSIEQDLPEREASNLKHGLSAISYPSGDPQIIPSEDEKPIQRYPVKSSNVTSAGYDEETQTMEIGFGRNGVDQRIYGYNSVTPEVYAKFLSAPSKGQFVWNEFIRKRTRDD